MWDCWWQHLTPSSTSCSHTSSVPQSHSAPSSQGDPVTLLWVPWPWGKARSGQQESKPSTTALQSNRYHRALRKLRCPQNWSPYRQPLHRLQPHNNPLALLPRLMEVPQDTMKPSTQRDVSWTGHRDVETRHCQKRH